jgi:hypothetical protein
MPNPIDYGEAATVNLFYWMNRASSRGADDGSESTVRSVAYDSAVFEFGRVL